MNVAVRQGRTACAAVGQWGVRCFRCTSPRNASVLESFWERFEGSQAAPHGGYHWFENFHSVAARTIRERLNFVDIVIETRDARIPFSSYNPELEKLTLGKPRLVVFTKAHLADIDANTRIKEYYRSLDTPCVLLDSEKVNADQYRQLLPLIENLRPPTYMRYPTTKVLVVGMPNVGKSTLVHGVRRAFVDDVSTTEGLWRKKHRLSVLRRRVKVGGVPGVTRKLGYVSVPSPRGTIQLIDSPGIISPVAVNPQQGVKLAMLNIMRTSHPKARLANLRTVAYLIFKMLVAHGLESNVMSYYRMLYPPPQTFSEFLLRVSASSSRMNRMSRQWLQTTGDGAAMGERFPFMYIPILDEFIAAFGRGHFGRVTLDEIPTLDDNFWSTAPSHMKQIHEELLKKEMDRKNLLRAQAEASAKGEEVGEVDIEPPRLWDVRAVTVEKKQEAEVQRYRVEKMVQRLKMDGAPITRRSGILHGDITEFQTTEEQDRAAGRKQRALDQEQASDEEYMKFRGTKKASRRNFSPMSMNIPSQKLTQIKYYGDPNPLNVFTDINILTGELKEKATRAVKGAPNVVRPERIVRVKVCGTTGRTVKGTAEYRDL